MSILHTWVNDCREGRTLIRDAKILYTGNPDQPSLKLDFVDSEAPASGESYYYVRVLQEDGIAWGSPAWITYRK